MFICQRLLNKKISTWFFFCRLAVYLPFAAFSLHSRMLKLPPYHKYFSQVRLEPRCHPTLSLAAAVTVDVAVLDVDARVISVSLLLFCLLEWRRHSLLSWTLPAASPANFEGFLLFYKLHLMPPVRFLAGKRQKFLNLFWHWEMGCCSLREYRPRKLKRLINLRKWGEKNAVSHKIIKIVDLVLLRYKPGLTQRMLEFLYICSWFIGCVDAEDRQSLDNNFSHHRWWVKHSQSVSLKTT